VCNFASVCQNISLNNYSTILNQLSKTDPTLLTDNALISIENSHNGTSSGWTVDHISCDHSDINITQPAYFNVGFSDSLVDCSTNRSDFTNIQETKTLKCTTRTSWKQIQIKLICSTQSSISTSLIWISLEKSRSRWISHPRRMNACGKSNFTLHFFIPNKLIGYINKRYRCSVVAWYHIMAWYYGMTCWHQRFSHDIVNLREQCSLNIYMYNSPACCGRSSWQSAPGYEQLAPWPRRCVGDKHLQMQVNLIAINSGHLDQRAQRNLRALDATINLRDVCKRK